MRLQYLSDLHFEFHADSGGAFVGSLDPRGVDVLVVAGDLTSAEGIGPALDLLCTRYANASVVYVHGNHEYYGSSRDEVIAITRDACARHANLTWLDAGATVIGERRFLGAPLWFRPPPESAAKRKELVPDFNLIRDFEQWVYAENARALAFFESELREGDVVVTHHLPSPACIAPAWKTSPLNPFFVCDVEPLIRERRPALWIHGHTHDSIDTTVGVTRIVCNPFGYVRFQENGAFREDAHVEV